MPATISQAPKAQPWKANWPPATKLPDNRKDMIDHSGALLIDGECPNTGPFYYELACSRKETEASVVQPWKANWPPSKDAAKAGRKDMVDNGGALLIDGDCAGARPFFYQLACSRKEAGKE